MTGNLFVNKKTKDQCIVLGIGKHHETKQTLVMFHMFDTIETTVMPLNVFNQHFTGKTAGG